MAAPMEVDGAGATPGAVVTEDHQVEVSERERLSPPLPNPHKHFFLRL
jgi:hypothetical protein